MKLQKMADTALKSMVKSYSESGNTIFSIEYFLPIFPDATKEHITDALYLLDHDSMVSVFPADGIAYTVSLNPSGIRDCEEKTLLKKGYQCIKEIRQLIG